MASTAIILILGILNMLAIADKIGPTLHILDLTGTHESSIWIFKLMLILVDFFIAFFCVFASCLRLQSRGLSGQRPGRSEREDSRRHAGRGGVASQPCGVLLRYRHAYLLFFRADSTVVVRLDLDGDCRLRGTDGAQSPRPPAAAGLKASRRLPRRRAARFEAALPRALDATSRRAPLRRELRLRSGFGIGILPFGLYQKPEPGHG
jgi:hypothetical protein